MASGHALAEYKRTGKRVEIVDFHRRRRWEPAWEGLDWIVRPGERGDFARVRNGPQCRPYIRYPFGRQIGQRYTGWRARDHVGAVALTDEERDFARRATFGLEPFVLIEPNLLPKSNPNKQWGHAKWKELTAILRTVDFRVVQVGPAGTRRVTGVEHIETPTFRHGAAVLERATASVLPEGGLHHAAGALNAPAVVLFGGAVPPEVTGYPHHTNIAFGEACGKWMPCPHCAAIWKSLKAETVAKALLQLIEGKADAPHSDEAQFRLPAHEALHDRAEGGERIPRHHALRGGRDRSGRGGIHRVREAPPAPG